MKMKSYLLTLPLALGLGIASASPPNLVVIHTDEHNFRTLGCYREVLGPELGLMWGKQAVVETPHIDSLAKRGVLCTGFYATSPVCTASRAAMMSGLSPHAAGAPTNNLPLKDGVETFAAVLGRQGYATSYIGKWHLDGEGRPQWAPKRKFGWDDNRFMFNRGHWKKFELTDAGPAVGASDRTGRPLQAVARADEKSYATDWLIDRAIDFVKARNDKPFCVFVSLPDPHGPNTVRAPYDTMFDHVTFKEPKTMRREPASIPKWGRGNLEALDQQSMRNYLGMVKCIDDNIGKLLATLKEQGLLDNTIVVFTADHGDLMGEHGRHNKGLPYEASAGVPFVIAGPGVARGKVLGTAMDMTDFGPTMLGLLGSQQTMTKAHGRDVSALLKTGEPPADWNDLVCLRAVSGLGEAPRWVAAVSDRWKLVLAPSDVPWLFDLEADPFELKNVAAAHPELVRQMAAGLDSWLETTQDPAFACAEYRQIFKNL
jgi:arylsulfatase A-like enzyme